MWCALSIRCVVFKYLFLSESFLTPVFLLQDDEDEDEEGDYGDDIDMYIKQVQIQYFIFTYSALHHCGSANFFDYDYFLDVQGFDMDPNNEEEEEDEESDDEVN